MNDPRQALSNLKISGNLPSMPQILVQLIDACHAQDVDLRQIAEIVSKDGPLSAKILQLVNSAFIGARSSFSDTGQAVVYLGADVIKNLAISVSVQQVFRRVETNGLLSLDRFWYHSFQNGLIAQQIATLINHPSPADAYLAGLLHDIGKLLLWMAFPGRYAPLLLKGVRCHNARLTFLEQEKLEINHCEAGAWLCEQWQLPSILADAIRYHHHPLTEVEQTLELTKIIALSDLLSHSRADSEEALQAAHQLFGISPAQLAELYGESEEQITRIAEEFKIRIPKESNSSLEPEGAGEEVHKETSLSLIRRVKEITQLTGVLENLLKAKDGRQIMAAAENSLKILFNEACCLFLLWSDESRQTLQACVSEENPLAGKVERFRFSLPSGGNSLLEQAITSSRLHHSFGQANQAAAPAHLLDQQLLHLLDRDGFTAVPLLYQEEPQGLMIIGQQQEDHASLLKQLTPLQLLSQHAAIAFYLETLHQRQSQALLQERIQAASLVARKVAHEINNPLAIIHNYIQILHLKAAQGEKMDTELATIDEELTRIGRLTEQLQDLSRDTPLRKTRPIELNPLLAAIITLYTSSPQKALPLIEFLPGEELPQVQASEDAIRQIMINLLSNAVEALSPEETIQVRTRHSGQQVTIEVADNGPGIPQDQLKDIFSPGVTNKHNGHAGLGLAIVRKLLSDQQGTISCTSDRQGTTFTLSLPAAAA
ncbi:HDOD domain-containing protein [Desulfogranum mediterraneum]|uniref:HDOD domain-containing protein n=1 Tax=Desulfogranum mediterraneum TaxID=160661 RepID=UPI00040895B7|nr:HDOD domain-containing protein [Desulfogranum mediterraneum]